MVPSQSTIKSCNSPSLSLALCGPIHDAESKGNEAKVIALLTPKLDLVSSRDNLAKTPLHLAALREQLATAAPLIATGADVNAHNVLQGTK
jgi:ankyrin repeat protein